MDMRSVLVALLAATACAAPPAASPAPADRAVAGPAGLPVTIRTDRGVMDVEREYLPGVVDCELGWYTEARPALEAQAIAARTYLARWLHANGATATVPIGAHFQCWRDPVWLRSRLAVTATTGVVLRHRGALIYANYVSGADRLADDCTPPTPSTFGYDDASWDDLHAAWLAGARFSGYAWTQIFVTENAGRAGADVAPTVQNRPTRLNRGALGQYAATCLAANRGYDTASILRHFYGEDVELEGLPPVADGAGLASLER